MDTELRNLNPGSPPLYYDTDTIIISKKRDPIKLATLILVIIIVIINVIFVSTIIGVYLTWEPSIQELYTSATELLVKYNEGYTKVITDWDYTYNRTNLLLDTIEEEWHTEYTNVTTMVAKMNADWDVINQKILHILNSFPGAALF